MAVLQTSTLQLPNHILDPFAKKIQFGSVIAQLTPAEPQKFGTGQAMTFDIGEAEYVGEGANKGPSTVAAPVKTVKPYKFHKTLRYTEEVLWADEDYQLGVISDLTMQIAPALSRALDFGVIHGINPTGGAAVAAMTEFLSQTTNSVEEVDTDKRYALLDAAEALVLADGFVPNGAAFDPAFAAPFRSMRDTDGRRLYPDFTLSAEPSMVDGWRVATSDTVGAVGVAASATNLLALVGDWNQVRWGVQRNIGLEVIRYGDPDGQGDLKRNNQIAIRAEVVYGWGIGDLDAFATIVDAVAG